MIDTHCHLSHRDFDDDRDAVLERCWENGVSAILEVGFSPETSGKAVEIARANPHRIRATVGIHPHEAGSVTDADWEAIVELSREPEVVAIGETGLDFYRNWSPREDQFAWFARQIRFAVKRDLPLIVHDRDAHDEVLATIRDAGGGRARGVVHCFSGDLRVAGEAVALGFYLGLGGSITYWNPRKKGRMLAELPLDRILLETDAPWLTPKPEKGERNDPTRMTHVVDRLAESRGVPREEILHHTRENTRRLFAHASPWPPVGR
jgi:TatD DNase family protein